MFVSDRTANLIGRRVELEALFDRFRPACEGHGGAVLITGDAGIGKSRLIKEFLTRIDLQPCRRSVGQCLEYAQAPYHPFLEVLRTLTGTVSTELQFGHDTFTRENTAEIGRRKLEAFQSFETTIQNLARSRPLVVAVEDAHWADIGTLELLQYIVPRLAPRRVLLIITCRVGNLSRTHALPAALERLARLGAECLHLTGLGEMETRTLMLRMLPSPGSVPAETLARIAEIADGNPLLLQELLRGALMLPGSAAADLRFPSNLTDTVAERLSRLEPSLRSVVVQASVIGRRFDSETLRAVARRPERLILEALRQARDLHLIAEDALTGTWYEFTHELIRGLVYRQLLKREALPLHARIAQHLERSAHAPNRIAELAYHWAAAGDAKKAVHYNALAGEMAMNVHAHGDVARFYRRALQFAPDSGVLRGELCDRLASALYVGGFAEEAKTWFDEAIAQFDCADDDQRVARILLRRARLEFFEARAETSLALANRALQSFRSLSEVTSVLLEAYTEVARYNVILGNYIEAMTCLERAESLSTVNGAALPVYFHDVRAIAYAHLGRDNEAMEAFRDAGAAVESSDVEAQLRVWNNYGCNASWLGHAEESIEAYRRTLELCEANGFLVRTAFSTLGLAKVMTRLGRLHEARTFVHTAIEVGLTTQLNRIVAAEVGIPLGIVLKDDALLTRLADPALLDHALENGSDWLAPLTGAFVDLALLRGDLEQPHALLHRAIRRTRTADHAWRMLVLTAAHGCAGDIQLAREILMRAPSTDTTLAGSAYACLFQSHIALRDGLRERGRALARAAAAYFERLRWPGEQAAALEPRRSPSGSGNNLQAYWK